MAKHLLALLFIWAGSVWIKVKIIILLENSCSILIRTFYVIGTVWVWFLARAMVLLFATVSRPALKSTQPIPRGKGTEFEVITHLQLVPRRIISLSLWFALKHKNIFTSSFSDFHFEILGLPVLNRNCIRQNQILHERMNKYVNLWNEYIKHSDFQIAELMLAV
jgi:hypothetical protein